MTAGVIEKRLLMVGAAMAAAGVALYLSLDWIGLTTRNLVLLHTSAVTSIGLTIFGLLAALIGGAMAAWKAEPKWTFVSAIVLALLTALLGKIVNINVHGPSAIVVLLVLAGGVGATMLFVLAMIRFLVVRKQSQE
jgi:hypothetical protein